jgi:tRNA(Arg) A34 adenosine deaminase TadA
MMQEDIYIRFLHEAIGLAESATSKGNEPFGALLAKGDQVLLRAENTVKTGRNNTHHAEMNLVQLAVAQYDANFLRDCTLYTSTEPCAMCAGAIYWAGVGRVVYACSERKLAELSGLALDVPCRMVLQSGTSKIEVIGPLIEDEALKPHRAYWKRT